MKGDTSMQLIKININTIGEEVKETVTTMQMLNALVWLSYQDPQEAYEYFNKVKGTVESDCEYLLDAVFTHILWAKSCGRTHERDVQKEFFNNLDKYLPGAVKVDVVRDRLHIPDGFVELEGKILPVEVKRDYVNHSTIKQIMRYMSEYKSQGGIVVAPALKSILPKNVIFVSVGGKK